MPMPYKVWSEEQIQERNVSPEGEYPFEVILFNLKKTKPGIDRNGNQKAINDMLELDLKFWDMEGVVRKQRDWIVFIDGMDWKLRHLANTLDLLEDYDNKTLEGYHLVGKTGVMCLGIKDMIGNDGVKKKVNYVKDYVKKGVGDKLTPTKHDDNPFIDDEIPDFK
jgi:hypothetical protein